MFDLIKEEALNNNPPVDQPLYLPGDKVDFPNVISIETPTPEITAGDTATIGVTRTNVLSTKSACSFKYYTTFDSPTLSSDFSHIHVNTPSIGVFEANQTNFNIEIPTNQFFFPAREFNVYIEPNTNCILPPTSGKAVVSVEPLDKQFTVSLSAQTGVLEEGTSNRIKIIRTPAAGVNFKDTEDTSVNISIYPINIENSQYVPNIPLSSEHATIGNKITDFASFGPSTVSAVQVANTSTIFFTNSITSVVFDLSAANNNICEEGERFLSVRLNNVSENATLGTAVQDVRINDDFKTTNLFLSSISATYQADGSSTTLLSCVNIWEALSASTADTNTTAFSTYSATHPFEVNFTVNGPLSVFSVSTVSGAIQFLPDEDLIFTNNKLNIIVDEDAAIVGKGGGGGHGALWLSGSDFTVDGTGSDDLSASEFGADDGGHAIGSTHLEQYFNVVSLTGNSGNIYGGAGGGGGGVLGVSASDMPNVSALSGGCGGGGGAGLHLSGAGLGGLAAAEEDDDENITRSSLFANLFLANGGAGTTTEGGSAGAFTNIAGNVTLADGAVIGIGTRFPGMSGLAGGNLGESGGSDNEEIPPIGSVAVDSSYSTISADWQVREGGAVGAIVEGSFFQVVSTGASGTFKGQLVTF